MTANTGFAAGRAEPADSLDDFPTPPWATRALLARLAARRMSMLGATVREPAANRGFMLRPLAEIAGRVVASDIHDYGVGLQRIDYLNGIEPEVDWTITNPPFNLAGDFIAQALELSRIGVAIFQRVSFIAGQERFEQLFSRRPPTYFMPFCERVPLFRGVLRDPEASYFDESTGKWRKPSTAADYAWFVWLRDHPYAGTQVDWIPPCRKQMTRPGDYTIVGNLGALCREAA